MSLSSAPIFAAASVSEPPQLKLGGSGIVPPKYPPTTYADPSGSTNDGKGLDKSKPTPLKAGDRYFLFNSPEGTPVYYDNGSDGEGRRKVWSYIESSDGKNPFYRFGVIGKDGDIEWQSSVTVKYSDANYPQVGGGKDPLPPGQALTVTDGKNYGSGSGQAESTSPQYERVLYSENQAEPSRPADASVAQNPSPSLPPAGTSDISQLKGLPENALERDYLALSPEGAHVYYDNTKDGQGRRNVWSYFKPANGEPFFRFGVEVADGKVEWQEPTPTRIANANYPQSPLASAPLPANKALIVTDGKNFGPGSGQAEVNSPQKERVFSAADVARWRPSQLEVTMAITPEQKQETAAQVDDFLEGEPLAGDTPSFAGKIASMSASAGGRAAVGVGAIYTMLGLTAAAKLMLNKTHPNDPMLLDQYLGQFDAFHLAMLSGFMLAAGPFLKRVPGLTSAGTVVRATPMLGAALLAGSIGGALVDVFSDTDVDQCLAIETFIKTGKSTNDMAACDRAYSKFNTEQMTLKYVPQLTRIMTTGALVMGSYFVVNASGLAGLLGRMPVLRSASPGAVGLGLIVFSFAAWIGADWIVSNVLQVELNTREYLLAEHTLASNPYGATMRESEEDLFKGWSALRAAHWVDVAKFQDAQACKYQTIAEGSNLPCVRQPLPPLDFAGVLARNATLQDMWRGVQMAPTYSAYQQWASKVQDYHAQLGAAFALYTDFIDRIAFENKNPGMQPSDPQGFNGDLIKPLVKAGVKSGDPIFKKDFSGTWKYVYTPNFVDYIVTSMACGPEAEGQVQSPSWLENAGMLVSTWVTGNTSPADVIQNRTGRSIVFHPPRVVRAQPGTNRSVCESPVTGTMPLSSPMGMPPNEFSVEAPWFSGQKSYRDLYAYIKDNVSAAINLNGQNNFPAWWTTNVITPALKTEADLRGEYEQMLKTTYTTALLNQQYYTGWCSESDLGNVSFAHYWIQLSPAQGMDCERTNMHRLALGLVDSLRDQLRLYLAMVADVYVDSSANTGGSAVATAENVVLPAAQDLLTAFDKIADQGKVIDAKSRTDFQTLGVDATAKFQHLRDVVFPIYDDNQERTPAQKIIESLLNERIRPLFSETRTFFTILGTFEPAPGTGG